MADHPPSDQPLKKTPLNDLEKNLGGKMVDFGGWELPVQFTGILDEHDAVRKKAGIFDVSHMGEIVVKGPDSLSLLQKMTCNDVSKLADGRAHYTGLLYPTGGFVDDILIYRNNVNDYFVVVNASNSDKDFEWMRDNAKGMDVEVANVSADYAQLAIQGPKAEALLQPMTSTDLSAIKYYRFAHGSVDRVMAIISRTGYTGEDGFELYVAPEHAPYLMQKATSPAATSSTARRRKGRSGNSSASRWSTAVSPVTAIRWSTARPRSASSPAAPTPRR